MSRFSGTLNPRHLYEKGFLNRSERMNPDPDGLLREHLYPNLELIFVRVGDWDTLEGCCHLSLGMPDSLLGKYKMAMFDSKGQLSFGRIGSPIIIPVNNAPSELSVYHQDERELITTIQFSQLWAKDTPGKDWVTWGQFWEK